MKQQKQKERYFSAGELALWGGSLAVAFLSSLFSGNAFWLPENLLTLTDSLIGVTALIFNAKGNPFGQVLMIAFSILYGIISYSFSYYGEMLTYLGMSMPMAVCCLISWLRNPYHGNKSEVRVNRIRKREHVLMWGLAIAVTVGFYFVLRYFNTANLLPSTLSVTTSFAAVYLTFRRSPYYAIGYAANDLVLILLWLLAAADDPSYLSVAACFFAFLVNDIYGFVSWRRMERRQNAAFRQKETAEADCINPPNG